MTLTAKPVLHTVFNGFNRAIYNLFGFLQAIYNLDKIATILLFFFNLVKVYSNVWTED